MNRRFQKVGVLLALILAIMGIRMIATSPASAGPLCDTRVSCGEVHSGRDNYRGYAIVVFKNHGDAFRWTPDGYVPDVDWTKETRVHEGQSSTDYHRDTDVVYVREKEEFWCIDGPRSQWEKVFDKKGPHKINDLFNPHLCELRPD